MGKNSPTLATITFIGLIKYGFWTVLVIQLYSNHYLASNPILYITLFILHIGMIAEAFLIPQISRFPKKALIIALIWFFSNDIMDYWKGTAPYLPDNAYHHILAAESILMTIILVIYSKKYR